ncbi:MAG: hypothetical protein WC655_24885, partial [Candidatus Hydrogenedentales bacterium]
MEQDRLACIEARLERIEKGVAQIRTSVYVMFVVVCLTLFLLFFGPFVALLIFFVLGVLYVSNWMFETVMKRKLATGEEQRVKERMLEPVDDAADLDEHGLPRTS